MKCYNHHDRDAFGFNVITGKALCLECLEEYKGFIIEKDSEFSRQAADKLLIGYKQIGANKALMKALFVMGLIFGIIFLFIGCLSFLINHPNFVLLLAGVFMLFLAFACKNYGK